MHPLASFCRPLLFAWGEGAIQLAVDEKVGQDPTGTPWYAVCPAFDARRCFFVDKNVAADDELSSLSVMRSAEAVRQSPLKASFEYEQGVLGGFDMTPPCRHTRRRLAHVHSLENDSVFLLSGRLVMKVDGVRENNDHRQICDRATD